MLAERRFYQDGVAMPLPPGSLTALLIHAAAALLGEVARYGLKVRISGRKRKLLVEADPEDVAASSEVAFPDTSSATSGQLSPELIQAMVSALLSLEELEVMEKLGTEELCADAIARRLGKREAPTRFKLMLSLMASRGILRSNRSGYTVASSEISRLVVHIKSLRCHAAH